MSWLRRNFHVVAFAVILLAFLKLQFNGEPNGWPIPFGGLPFNFVPGIFVLGLAMIPFGYRKKQTMSIASLVVLVLAASLVARILSIGNYLDMHSPIDRALIFFLMTMMLYGVLSGAWRLVSSQIEWPSPQFKRRE